MGIKFQHELFDSTDFSKELLEEMLATGYAVEQMVDGISFIKLTSLYYRELGDYICSHPKELCIEYWNELVDDTKNCDIMEFVYNLCSLHNNIKTITEGKVDFCAELLEEFK